MHKIEFLSDHIRIEKRSIALHKAIAQHLKANPELLCIAKKNLKSWKEIYLMNSREFPEWLTQWNMILEQQSLDKIIKLLVSRSETARRLRQSSPLAGLLSQEERMKIYETFSIRTYYSRRRRYRPG